MQIKEENNLYPLQASKPGQENLELAEEKNTSEFTDINLKELSNPNLGALENNVVLKDSQTAKDFDVLSFIPKVPEEEKKGWFAIDLTSSISIITNLIAGLTTIGKKANLSKNMGLLRKLGTASYFITDGLIEAKKNIEKKKFSRRECSDYLKQLHLRLNLSMGVAYFA